jgi:nucleoside-diphosphate-sugar epimerase
MSQRIFLAGVAGAIGRRMLPLLRHAGYLVFGTTRSAAKAEELRSLGVEPVVVDVFDMEMLARALEAARPDTVIHQLTDLPKNLEPSLMGDALVRNARIRAEGIRNLVIAANRAGARRLVTQSICWAYAPGAEPRSEDDPLDANAEGVRGITVRGVVALESCTLASPPLEGIVLRYGQLYGPGTHSKVPSSDAPVHVDAAAYAAVLAHSDAEAQWLRDQAINTW